MWAAVRLFDAKAWTGVGGFIGAGIGVEWSDRQAYGSWAERRVLARAVHERIDPGPARRAIVDQAARSYLAVHGRAWWGASLVVAGLGTACLVLARIRDDAVLLWPGSLLLVLAAGYVVILRRALDRADRWLVEPPTSGVGSP
jgi:hypothetical protein